MSENNLYRYAILMETSGSEFESWYTFIRYEGNEESLNFLQEQLQSVRWRIVDDFSTFDLEIDTLVSEKTAKEITLIDLNPTFRHRKFDGILKKIDLGFDETNNNKRKIKKAFKILGFGKIENFIDKEDIEENEELDEELISSSDSEDETDSEDDTDSSSESSSSSEEESKKIEPIKKPIVRTLPSLSRADKARKLKLCK